MQSSQGSRTRVMGSECRLLRTQWEACGRDQTGNVHKGLPDHGLNCRFGGHQGSTATDVERDPKQRRSSTDADANFSRSWDSYFHSGPAGCQHEEGTPSTYRWRGTDWGKNLDGLVLAWTHAISNGNGDIAVVVEPDGLAPEGGACPADNEHGDEEAGGWPRFFTPMAHLCVFSSQQDFHDFLATRDLNQPPDGRHLGMDEDEGGDPPHAWGQDPDIRKALEGTATDQAQAMARVLHYLLSHVQPRLQGKVQAVLHEPDVAFFSDKPGKYVGMFVRKTEGRTYKSLKMTETLDCFEKAFKYIEDLDRFSAGHISFSEITGIFLVSEDTTALPEAKSIVRRYFGKVKSDKVVQLVAADPGPSATEGEVDLRSSCGTSDGEREMALKQTLVELQLLAQADVFVGVASESFSKLVFLMRETLQFARKTSLSMDETTPFPGMFR
ncbi:expressed unknown protein [Ectocarpus siliculosus]|uniref:Uncharacterized protein n=1 Tax=Ectocarpus siliculosus TaxID=2880 RepID=D8LIU6_ECTSI|nr:expressed unknown protein [Ectocarpus siliculosus]|eukprot:CBN76830.1 expressed unknown protein [Ectocarpus siliculosus]